MIDKDRLEWLKEALKSSDYCRVGQWGDAGADIEGEVQDIIEELEKLRERERGYLAELADYGRTVNRLRQESKAEKVYLRRWYRMYPGPSEEGYEVDRLTKRCEEARDLIDSDHPTHQYYVARARWLEGKP